MKERPILFSGAMVRAILAGRKTQTRRVVKPQPDDRCTEAFQGADGVWRFSRETVRAPVSDAAWDVRCPYGRPAPTNAAPPPNLPRYQRQPGDRLWVREAWAQNEDQLSDTRIDRSYVYRADDERRALDNGCEKPWRPSIHMPRKASRITLEVTDVRVERLQEISEADAIAEGAPCVDEATGREVLFPATSKAGSHRLGFRALWEQINGAGAWEANPWVWVVEFKRIEQEAAR